MVARFLILAIVWLLLDGGSLAGLVIGLPVALLAAVVSCRLLPPGTFRLRMVPLLSLLGYCLRESVTAGWDVAVRALQPRMPLSVGIVRVPCGIPPGPRRNVLMAAASLMPGSLPIADDGDLVLHVLDDRRPTAEQTKCLENLVCKALGCDE